MEIIALILGVIAVALSAVAVVFARDAQKDAKSKHETMEAGIVARIERGLDGWSQKVQADLNTNIPVLVAKTVEVEVAKHNKGHLVIEGPEEAK